MIASFRSKALERFWWKGQARRVQSTHVAKLTLILAALDAATKPDDMDRPTFGFHSITGDMAGRHAVTVDRNWRVTFAWSQPNAIEVDYEDYH